VLPLWKRLSAHLKFRFREEGVQALYTETRKKVIKMVKREGEAVTPRKRCLGSPEATDERKRCRKGAQALPWIQKK
jgi:hypothetical protein